jgi:hypothetical protein
MKYFHFDHNICKSVIYLGENITLETSPAEVYDGVLLYVHLPLQLRYHTGNCNPTCTRHEKNDVMN